MFRISLNALTNALQLHDRHQNYTSQMHETILVKRRKNYFTFYQSRNAQYNQYAFNEVDESVIYLRQHLQRSQAQIHIHELHRVHVDYQLSFSIDNDEM